MRSLVILLAALLFVHLTAAKCNSRIVKEIKDLKLNNEHILSNLDGEYKFAFSSIGEANTKNRSGPCIKIRFFKEEDTSKIEYVGVAHGIYKTELVDGVIQQTGPEGKVDMVAHIVANGPDVIAFHICSELFENQGPSLSVIAVSVKAENPMEMYKKARSNLGMVGIKTGTEVPGCITGDGGPVEEENNEHDDDSTPSDYPGDIADDSDGGDDDEHEHMLHEMEDHEEKEHEHEQEHGHEQEPHGDELKKQ